LFKEIQRPLSLPITVYEDNQPTIDLVTNTTGRFGRSKHFLMIINFVREQVQEGLLKMNKIPTEENISNVLTKIVNAPEFYHSFSQILGMIDKSDQF
jgi:hypothetical protein